MYVAHPPLTPHDWNVQLPKYNEPVKKIFYEEDIVRALVIFHYSDASSHPLKSILQEPSQRRSC